MAESFAFATLFPNVLQPPVSVISNTIFRWSQNSNIFRQFYPNIFSLLVRCKICKKPVRRYDVGAPSGITISIPGADSQDAERRRQIALRALSGEKYFPKEINIEIFSVSERLNKSEAAQSQWPSMDDPENTER